MSKVIVTYTASDKNNYLAQIESIFAKAMYPYESGSNFDVIKHSVSKSNKYSEFFNTIKSIDRLEELFLALKHVNNVDYIYNDKMLK